MKHILSFLLSFIAWGSYAQHTKYLVYEREILQIEHNLDENTNEDMVHIEEITDFSLLEDCLDCELDTIYMYIGVWDTKRKKLFRSTDERSYNWSKPKHVKAKPADKGLFLSLGRFQWKYDIQAQVVDPDNFRPTDDLNYRWFLFPVHESIADHHSILKNGFIRFLPVYQENNHESERWHNPITIESTPAMMVTVTYDDFIVSDWMISWERKHLEKRNRDMHLESYVSGSIITKAKDGSFDFFDWQVHAGHSAYMKYTADYTISQDHENNLKKLVGHWETTKIRKLPDSTSEASSHRYELDIDEDFNCTLTVLDQLNSSVIETHEGSITMSPSGDRLIFDAEILEWYYGWFWTLIHLEEDKMVLNLKTNRINHLYTEYQEHVTFQKKSKKLP